MLTEATDNRVKSRGTQLLDEFLLDQQQSRTLQSAYAGSQENLLTDGAGGQRAFFYAPLVFVPVAQYLDNALAGRLAAPGLENPVFDVLRSLKYLFRILLRSHQDYELFVVKCVLPPSVLSSCSLPLPCTSAIVLFVGTRYCVSCSCSVIYFTVLVNTRTYIRVSVRTKSTLIHISLQI